MYLTAVDLSWEGEWSHSDPDREEEETRDSGMIFFFVPLGGARVLSPAQERARPGYGGKYDPFLGTPTNPALAPSLYPGSDGQKDRWQVQGRGHWLWLGVWGASGHCCALGIPSTCCMRISPPGAAPGRFRSLGGLHFSHLLLSCPGGHWQMAQRREETHCWKKQPMTAPLPGIHPRPLPAPLPGV